MSLIPKAPLRQMRIISIPLTRPKNPYQGATDPKRILTYYQFQIPSRPNHPNPVRETKPKTKWRLPEEGVIKFLQAKATSTWAGFGQAKEGSWQLKIYRIGEQLSDRIEFEEHALKGLDASLGPSLAHSPLKGEKKLRVPLIYPSSLSSSPETLSHFKAFLQDRMPQHRRGFYFWMLISPFTAPFMIIPIIPNLPFFFCVWRSWSHYKAYRTTQYLHDLVVNDVIKPEGNEDLDAIIIKGSHSPEHVVSEKSPNNSSESKEGGNSDKLLLLSKDTVPSILTLFGLKATADIDLSRAIWQARQRAGAGWSKS
ncbi:hypothetical protein AGABI1DRAFT_128372 [Agaricus bisporus var. burnettii JB137-S8]|uniref:Mitochondrial K+-H+ exchange-related-domain-containing protein n=1 Tax=Agaricus bisporus var. burnettii (strain JB137-S8 / ATCC MYA-4627 / FGSC 10392) TaxID=597362 RepID=K5WUT4_AGABU|nr:uncharacterized protein AGABI1DRAFT_128372 [Agaricus bisporus var. burnettii JB137-S8]EKM79211.1 hypothetical protein AGABI1DRAFT_128372 [Agaricus bisporus var. burnettii JB137-S8]